ncbi:MULTISPECIES: DUF4334 domain-containing protein [unclassified Ensifer]|uniref:DUF4334 domain-containing protein n=1 Tax=unclassified Ensifer TaxID=2633371 RepID=UPI0009CE5904|nr:MULTISPECIES: DUF4334 domain-containing protein [unclassified Ensifer]MBD9489999.1 DUF4334 domain-containing protein [Ensifer sp. ENS11]MDP9632493.1 hypothetical protein [Ensifer adhaerens]OMQ43714.1 hypothetical protein BKP54_17005 [Ensifer sp. 1H6]
MIDLTPITTVEALGRFRKLPPVYGHELAGLWRGSGVPTGHPLDGVLENLGWFGKRFHPNLRADALLFQIGPGRLVALEPAYIPLGLALRLGSIGRTRLVRHCFRFLQRPLRARGPTATLEMQDFEGIRSAAMRYDRQPIMDRFRRIGDHQLFGMMSAHRDPRPYFFTLTRQE